MTKTTTTINDGRTGIRKFRLTPAEVNAEMGSAKDSLDVIATQMAEGRLYTEMEGYVLDIHDVQVWATASGKSIMVQFTYSLAPEAALCPRAETFKDCPIGHSYIGGRPYHRSMEAHEDYLASEAAREDFIESEGPLPSIEGFDIEVRASRHTKPYISVTRQEPAEGSGRPSTVGVAIIKPTPRGFAIFSRNDLGTFKTAQAAAEAITTEYLDKKETLPTMTTDAGIHTAKNVTPEPEEEKASPKRAKARRSAKANHKARTNATKEKAAKEKKATKEETRALIVKEAKSTDAGKEALGLFRTIDRGIVSAFDAVCTLEAGWDAKYREAFGGRSLNIVAAEVLSDDSKQRISQMVNAARNKRLLGDLANDLSMRAYAAFGADVTREQMEAVITNIVSNGGRPTVVAIRRAITGSPVASGSVKWTTRLMEEAMAGRLSAEVQANIIRTLGQYGTLTEGQAAEAFGRGHNDRSAK